MRISRSYYTTNWTDEQRDFIMENLQYLRNSDKLDPLQQIFINKFRVEHDIYLEVNNGYAMLPTRVDRRVNIMYLLNCNTYEELEQKYNEALANLRVTEEEFKWWDCRAWLYSYTYPFFHIEGNKVSLHVKDEYGLSSVLGSIDMFLTDEVQEDLGKINELLKLPKPIESCCFRQDSYRAYQAATFDLEGLKIKTFKNGKVEIKGCPDEMLERMRKFERMTIKMFKMERNYKCFVEREDPEVVYEEFLC